MRWVVELRREHAAIVLGRVLGLSLVLALAGCAMPTSPVTVTRFSTPGLPSAPRRAIRVVAAEGLDPAGLEIRSFEAAVAAELSRLGYGVLAVDDAPAPTSAPAPAVAEVKFSHEQAAPPPSRMRVTLGAGAGTWSSGAGAGVVFPLGTRGAGSVTTMLAVRIRSRPDGPVLWEGRAEITIAPGSPLADTQLGAARLAGALFAGFPGVSGETITVP